MQNSRFRTCFWLKSVRTAALCSHGTGPRALLRRLATVCSLFCWDGGWPPFTVTLTHSACLSLTDTLTYSHAHTHVALGRFGHGLFRRDRHTSSLVPPRPASRRAEHLPLSHRATHDTSRTPVSLASGTYLFLPASTTRTHHAAQHNTAQHGTASLLFLARHWYCL